MKLFGILMACLIGIVFPQLAEYQYLIRYFLIVMLGITFLQMEQIRRAADWTHLKILAANFFIPLVFWGFLRAVDKPDLAAAAFMTGITPTAAAAAVVMKFLGGKSEYVLGSFLLTNTAAAILIPVMLPVLGMASGMAELSAFRLLALEMLYLMVIPFLAAFLLKKFFPGVRKAADRLGKFSFWLWLSTMCLIVGRASAFLRERNGELRIVMVIALLSMVICALNFFLGNRLGGKTYAAEGSQSLGQKNTAFTIYIALVYVSPLAALGPMFYVFWHNIWNGIQLEIAAGKKRKEAGS